MIKVELIKTRQFCHTLREKGLITVILTVSFLILYLLFLRIYLFLIAIKSQKKGKGDRDQVKEGLLRQLRIKTKYKELQQSFDSGSQILSS